MEFADSLYKYQTTNSNSPYYNHCNCKCNQLVGIANADANEKHSDFSLMSGALKSGGCEEWSSEDQSMERRIYPLQHSADLPLEWEEILFT